MNFPRSHAVLYGIRETDEYACEGPPAYRSTNDDLHDQNAPPEIATVQLVHPDILELTAGLRPQSANSDHAVHSLAGLVSALRIGRNLTP